MRFLETQSPDPVQAIFFHAISRVAKRDPGCVIYLNDNSAHYFANISYEDMLLKIGQLQ